MSSTASSSSSRSLLVAVLAIGATALGLAALVLRHVWSPEPEVDCLRDDAYYYFCWARSLAQGLGPCVTAGVPTSGVHVLWALLLTCAVWLTGSEQLPWVAQHLGLLLHLATAALLFLAAGKQRLLGLAVAGVYLGSPFLLDEAQNGQETGLVCLCLAAFVLWCKKGNAWFFGLGLLLVAARSDLFPVVLALALASKGHRRQRLLATAMILLLYGLWNWLLAGSLLQDSATPIPWLLADEFAQGNPTAGDHLARYWLYFQPILLCIPMRLASSLLALSLLLAAVFGLRQKKPFFALLLLGLLAMVVVHNLWRFYPRDYYYAPFGIAGALALLRLLERHEMLGRVLLLLALLWNGKHLPDPPPTRSWQRDMLTAALTLDKLAPGSERIGCFNAGILTWYHPERVVNLDGVVNRPAFAALEQHQLLAYLQAQGIHLLLDNPIQFERRGVHACGRHFGPDFVAARDLVELVRFLQPALPLPEEKRRLGTEYFALYRRRNQDPDTTLPEVATDLGATPSRQGRYVAWPGKAGRRLFAEPGDRTLVQSGNEGILYVLPLVMAGPGPLRLFDEVDSEPVLELIGR